MTNYSHKKTKTFQFCDSILIKFEKVQTLLHKSFLEDVENMIQDWNLKRKNSKFSKSKEIDPGHTFD
jgi:hypothetical protein